MMLTIIPKLDSSLFTWSIWRSGSPIDLGIKSCRYKLLTSKDGIYKLRKYAIGYCFGENLICRPKPNTVAVMFNVRDITFWFHLRNNEFNKIFINNTGGE